MIIEKDNYRIHIFDDHWAEPLDVFDDNVDVYVEFKSGEKYVATFFTLQNLYSLMEKNKRTGECDNGKYFWASDMIIVRELTSEIIQDTIEDLITNDDLSRVFMGPFQDDEDE